MSDLLKRTQVVRREIFDPRDKEHLESFKTFLRTGNWGVVQFYPELPYIEVPMTVLMKYSTHMLKVTTETRIQRQDRIDTLSLTYLATPSQADQQDAIARSNKLIDSMRRQTADAN